MPRHRRWFAAWAAGAVMPKQRRRAENRDLVQLLRQKSVSKRIDPAFAMSPKSEKRALAPDVF
jgi:hypothetical protein